VHARSHTGPPLENWLFTPSVTSLARLRQDAVNERVAVQVLSRKIVVDDALRPHDALLGTGSEAAIRPLLLRGEALKRRLIGVIVSLGSRQGC
jgi:chorismate-pyruvate lyase